jgi:multidrug efflux pump subunit AcrA (membrane-fusion protein)
MRRRPALATVALAALAAAAVVGAVVVVGSPAAGSAQERTVTVARGVIQSTVSGSGNLEPANQVDVDFATSGEITHIYVKAGQHVARDQLLAKVDPDAANVALAQAQASLQSAQDALDEAETAAATTAGATTTTTASASKSAGGNSSSGSGSGSGGATSTMTVAAAQANLDSAQLSVTSAEKDLAATTLRAPMAGTVTVVNGAVGTTVGGGSSSSSSSSSSVSGGATVTGGLGGGGASASTSGSSSSSSFITLAQISRYKMQVSLSESDIGSVKVGEPATVTVNAASGEEFAARVSEIGVLSSSSGSGSSSAVSYPVTLTLDQTSGHLKAGMSATADIVTSQVTEIAVPSQALTGSTVTVEAADGTQTTQRVQTGVVGDSTTQIVSGLKVGNRLVVRSAAAALGAAAGGTDQLNNAIRSRVGAGGLAGGLGGGGAGAGAGFGGGGGARLRGAGGGGGGTP